MQEKIKVSVPLSVYELLRRDAENFLIVKPNGEPNLNALVNTLIVNFCEEFVAAEEAARERIRAALSSVPERYAAHALEDVMHALHETERDEGEGGRCVSLSFKPTRASEGTVLYIERVLLRNESLSSFYRRMFVDYTKRTRTVREQLIHRENYEILRQAVSRSRRVCLSSAGGYVHEAASVYAVAPAKDELYNYVLFHSGGENRTVRLAKIRTVTLLPDPAEIPAESAALFSRQIECGAQYPIAPTDNEPIRVRLTERGRELYRRIYLNRPTPIAIEGDEYIFHCSANQALYYFERFGSEALVLTPRSLGILLRNYYHFAAKRYRAIYGKE